MPASARYGRPIATLVSTITRDGQPSECAVQCVASTAAATPSLTLALPLNTHHHRFSLNFGDEDGGDDVTSDNVKDYIRLRKNDLMMGKRVRWLEAMRKGARG